MGEGVDVAARMATPLRDVSEFDVTVHGLRTAGKVDHVLMDADPLEYLRLAFVALLSVGFSLDINDEHACLDRETALGAAFTSAVGRLRMHKLSNILRLLTVTVQGVVIGMVHDDLRPWVK